MQRVLPFARRQKRAARSYNRYRLTFLCELPRWRRKRRANLYPEGVAAQSPGSRGFASARWVVVESKKPGRFGNAEPALSRWKPWSQGALAKPRDPGL